MQNAKIQRNDSVRSGVKNYPPHTGEQVDNQCVTSIRDLWYNYKSEVVFFLILSSCVALGHYLSRYIPTELFDDVLAPLQNAVTTAICLFGAYVLFRHSDGLRIRKSCAWALVAWGIADGVLLLQTYVFHTPVFHLGTEALNSYTMLMGNFLGWLLLVYPTESLRPGWMNWKIAMYQLLPMIALVILDYFVAWDLRWMIAFYPVVLFVFVCTHIRAYRIWCEENYSSMDRIDVQWIVRYLIMLFVMGVSYAYMCVSDNPCRSFTQNILLVFMFAYSTEQILFRKDPWEGIKVESLEFRDERNNRSNECEIRSSQVESNKLNDANDANDGNDAQRAALEHWMRETKPYLNPDFQLMDLRAVLPMNRTYLSRFIRDEFGCTFYQFVNKYRIDEAKRLMTEQPEMRLADVATRSGFSSREAFARTFTQVTGLSPREWEKECNNS
ncbi:MAG: AraC family transcriptional regulator [Paludibacteraceae bacterium]|nr:AraC family transcriptional regulator [Paludibacteraceae bacterium]